MTEDIGAAILQAIDSFRTSTETKILALDEKVASIDARLASLEEKVASIDVRLTSLEGKAASLEGKVASIDVRLTSLEGKAASLEGRVASIDVRLASLEGKVASLDENFGALNQRIDSWPNMHFLMTAARKQVEYSIKTDEHLLNIETRIDEIQRMMPTAPEIAKLRDEVTRSLAFRQRLDMRVSTLEAHLGLENPLQ
jgi:chromosome segregation ATPase